jgi:DNA-binding CsgD family transcriptional regulator/PAS domain-containing protein
MVPADNLLGLIEKLYAAPGTTEGWHAFLESVRVAVDGSGSSLICQDQPSQQRTVAVAAQIDPEGVRLYDQHWGSADPWANSPRIGRLAQRPGVFVGEQLISHRDLRRTAWYQDFARHYDIATALTAVIEGGSDTLSVVSINGSARRAPFCEREIALLEPLVPHIRRALQLHRRLIAAESTAADFASVLDQSSQAVFMTDSEGRVSFLNQAASRLTRMRDGLTYENGELRAAREADTTRLRALLADAIKTSSGEGLGAGGVLPLGRPSGRRPLALLVSPVPRRQTRLAGLATTAAMVFVSDPEQGPLPTEDMLHALFGLTPAEAKLTRVLAQGASLEAAAACLGLRRETVRSRVKAIFEKTSTHRQAELVRLVLTATPS